MAFKIGITRFLGTNCDHDVKSWLELKGHKTEYLWFDDQFDCKDFDMVVIPGGFSHGDYLRCGAIAARTKVMKSVHEFAKLEKPILGICNGFQILCESGLLPGVLTANKNLRFIDKLQKIKITQTGNPFSNHLALGQTVTLPIAHGEGNYYAESETLKQLQDNNQIWMTYDSDINGSLFQIAGITNAKHNICALMPHPERALFDWMGTGDGGLFL